MKLIIITKRYEKGLNHLNLKVTEFIFIVIIIIIIISNFMKIVIVGK